MKKTKKKAPKKVLKAPRLTLRQQLTQIEEENSVLRAANEEWQQRFTSTLKWFDRTREHFRGLT